MSQSLSQLWVHIIFSTKKRAPFLRNKKLRTQLHKYLKGTCYKQGCRHVTIGGAEDHVHLLINLSKDLPLSHIIAELKKSSSKWIKTLAQQYPPLNDFYWQNGYGAFSVSFSKIKPVEQYIKNQEQHHKKINLQQELKSLCTHHGFNFNEGYFWD